MSALPRDAVVEAKGKGDGPWSCTRTPGVPDCECMTSTPPSHRLQLHLSTAATNRADGVFGNHRWFGAIQEQIEAFIDAIRTIATEGLIAYFKKLLQRKLGALFNIIAPLFDEIWGLNIGPVKIDGDLVGWRDLVHPSQVVHKAVAFVLWEFLDAFARIHSTGGWNDPDVDDDTRRDYWVDKGE